MHFSGLAQGLTAAALLFSSSAAGPCKVSFKASSLASSTTVPTETVSVTATATASSASSAVSTGSTTFTATLSLATATSAGSSTVTSTSDLSSASSTSVTSSWATTSSGSATASETSTTSDSSTPSSSATTTSGSATATTSTTTMATTTFTSTTSGSTTTTTTTTTAAAPDFYLKAANSGNSNVDGYTLQYPNELDSLMSINPDSSVAPNYNVAFLQVDPSTNRLMASNYYVYTLSDDFQLLAGPNVFAGSYVSCDPLHVGAALSCRIEGSTYTQFAITAGGSNNFILSLVDPGFIGRYNYVAVDMVVGYA